MTLLRVETGSDRSSALEPLCLFPRFQDCEAHFVPTNIDLSRYSRWAQVPSSGNRIFPCIYALVGGNRG